MHRFHCHFQINGGDIELSTVVDANDDKEAETTARQKLFSAGFSVKGLPCIADMLE